MTSRKNQIIRASLQRVKKPHSMQHSHDHPLMNKETPSETS